MKTHSSLDYRVACLGAGVVLSLLAGGVQAETFDQALVSALAASNLLKAQGAQTQVLQARKFYAVGGYLPEVMFDYSRGQARTRRDNTPWLEGSVDTRTLTLSQPLVDVAAIKGMGAASSRLKGGVDAWNARRQQVLLEATDAYATLAEAQETVTLYDGDVARLKQHVAAEEERFKAGVNTRTDIRQAEARLAEAQGRLYRAKGEQAAAEAAYVKVVGDKPELVVLPAFPKDVPATLDEALERARKNNPDLLAAYHDAKAARSDLGTRRAERLPTVNLLANAGKVHGIEDANGIEETQDQSVMVNVRVPIFMKGREYASSREAKALTRKAQFDEAAVQQNVTEQVTASWAMLKAGEDSLEALTQAVNAAQATLDGLQAEFESGSRTGLDVLDARREVLRARLDLLAERKDMLVQAYRLLGLMDGILVDNTGDGI